jgi:hypothetical protein
VPGALSACPFTPWDRPHEPPAARHRPEAARAAAPCRGAALAERQYPVSLAIALASVLLACVLFLDEAVHHWRGALDPALRRGFALP